MNDLIALAQHNFHNIFTHALLVGDSHVLVVYDDEHELTTILVEALKKTLPQAEFVLFSTVTPEEIRTRFDNLHEGDLVVLIQSTNFRLNEFRLRIELFNRNLKTLEITHLSRNTPDQYETLINALAYDPEYYRPLGKSLKAMLDTVDNVEVHGDGVVLRYEGGMEDAKLNIGDYSGMKNVGGTFPIGEVFTEAKDLTKVNGSLKIFAFAGEDHKVKLFTPFTAHVTEGILTAGEDAPEEFRKLLLLIAEDEPVTVREFGLGLNPAMGKHALVNDITAFERMKGLHLSLGAKHSVYSKPGFKKKHSRYHVDVFVDVSTMSADGKIFFENGEYFV